MISERKILPTKEELHTLFFYRDGMLFNKIARSSNAKLGERAGHKTIRGYRTISSDGKIYQEHRLIWIMHHGNIPAGFQIDHRDLDKGNNIISNLRVATEGQQKQNKSIRKDSTSGYKGVKLTKGGRKKPYESRIIQNGVYHHLGYYDNPVDAHAAYQKAAVEYFGEFARF